MRKSLWCAVLAASVAAPALAQETELMAEDVAAPNTEIVFVRPEVAVDGYTPIEDHAGMMEKLSDLEDADLYSSVSGDEIGEVEDLIADTGGQIQYMEFDVGGFLGIGDKEILVPIDQIQILTDGDEDYRVYIDATEDQLESYPEYDD